MMFQAKLLLTHIQATFLRFWYFPLFRLSSRELSIANYLELSQFKAQFRRRTFHEPNRLNSNLDRPKLTKVCLLIQTSNLIRRT